MPQTEGATAGVESLAPSRPQSMTKAEADAIVAAGEEGVKHHAIESRNEWDLRISLRAELLAKRANIPHCIRSRKAWFNYRVVFKKNGKPGKFDKIPVYPRSGAYRRGEQGTPEDLEKLGTFEDALAALQRDRSLAGIGLATLKEFGIVVCDVDGCFNEDGTLREDAESVTDDTYCERSPSGKGVHAIYLGEAKDGKNHVAGFEVFHNVGFVTVTGDQVRNVYSLLAGPEDPLPELTDDKRAVLEALSRPPGKGGEGNPSPDGAERPVRPAGEVDEEVIDDLRSALEFLDSDDREEWIRIGYALKTAGEEGRELWLEWSENSPKFDDEIAEKTWEGFEPAATDYRAVFAAAQRAGWVNPGKDSPERVALEFDDVSGEGVPKSAADRRERGRKLLAERDEKAAQAREEKRVAREEAFLALGLPAPTAAADLATDTTERSEVQAQEDEAPRRLLLDKIKGGGIPPPARVEAIAQTGLLTPDEIGRIKRSAALEKYLVDITAGGDPFAPLPHCVDKWLPCDEVTMLSGHGGGGKSFVALNLATHVALGLPFGDLATVQTPVLFFSCEDSTRVLRQRLAKLCGALMLDMNSLAGKLLLFDASDIDPALYRKMVVENEVFTSTPLLREMSTLVRMLDVGLVVIDGASDTFDGEEIRRAEVRTFIRSLRQELARPGRAVLFLAHINKVSANGNNPGGRGNSEDYSGSTAWHNSVRSRLSLTNQGANGLQIEHMKANLGEKAPPVEMVWHEGAPIVARFLSTPPAAVEHAKAVERAKDEADKAALVSIIQDFDNRGESVTTAAQGPYSTFKLLNGVAGFPANTDAPRTNRLLRELETEGRIFRRSIRKGYKNREIFTCGAPVGSPPIPPADTVGGL